MGGKAGVNQFLNRNGMQQIREGYRQSVSGDKAVGRTDGCLRLQHAKCVLVLPVLTERDESGRSFNGDPANQCSRRQLVSKCKK